MTTTLVQTRQQGAGPTYTWQELSKHTRSDSCWIALKGKVYDVTQWLDKHPGGNQMVLIASGRDCTQLFESYHKLSTPDLLDNGTYSKYVKYLGELESYEFPPYPEAKTTFYTTMKTRVEQYFKKNSIDPRATSLKTTLNQMFVFAALLVCLYMSFTVANLALAVAFAIGVGAFHGLCMAHVFHDLSHGSVRHYPKLWFALGYLTDFFMGHSFLMWMHRHVVGHHVYTNVSDVDPDIGVGAVYRACDTQPWKPHFRWQGLYKPFIYGLGAAKIQFDDVTSMLKGTMESIRVNLPYPVLDSVIFWTAKVFFLAHRLILPPLLGASFGRAVLLFLVTELVAGYWFAFITQVSHITKSVKYPSLPVDGDWAALQVATTVDYGHGSFWNTYLTGCLNYQAVHHLFPSVSQQYYPEITPIIQKTCEEYKVEYRVLPGWCSAFALHIRWMSEMGQDPHLH